MRYSGFFALNCTIQTGRLWVCWWSNVPISKICQVSGVEIWEHVSVEQRHGIHTSGKHKVTYTDRIKRVINFIHSHLDDDLSVEELAVVAGFSKHHFHRQFTAYSGIPVARLVQLMRLKRASYQLAFNRLYAITDIAMDARYENSESFSRAFRKTFGQSPSEFRANPEWQPWREIFDFQRELTENTMDVEIIDFRETLVAALEHRGAPETVYDTSRQFIEWRKAHGVAPDAGMTFGVHYSDERNCLPEEYRLDLCVSIAAPVPPNSHGVLTKIIPGGRCAKVRHLGSREFIPAANYLYEDWLPQSGEELRDYPIFFHYVNVGPGIEEHQMITDVYLPIR